MPKHLLNPNKWIDLYADYLFNYTISRVNDREMAQDLVQETFLAGLKSMKNFKGEDVWEKKIPNPMKVAQHPNEAGYQLISQELYNYIVKNNII